MSEPKRRRHLVKDLDIEFVSGVDRGASPGAQVTLLKRRETGDTGEGEATRKKGGERMGVMERVKAWFVKGFDVPRTVNEFIDYKDALAEFGELRDAFLGSIHSILENASAEEQLPMLQQTVAEFSERAGGLLPRLASDDEVEKIREAVTGIADTAKEVAKAGRVISEANLRRLRAAMTALEQVLETTQRREAPERTGGGNPHSDDEKKRSEKRMVIEDVLKGLDDEQRQVIEDELAKAREAAAETKKPEEETINKEDLPEPVRKRIEALETAQQEATKRAEEAERIAKAEREAREWADLVKRAEAFHYVGAAEDVAKDLKEAYGVSEEFGKRLEERFRATHEQLAKSNLFAELGRATVSEDSPEGKLEGLAKEYQKSNSDVTYEQAYEKVSKKHPDLLEAAVAGKDVA